MVQGHILTFILVTLCNQLIPVTYYFKLQCKMFSHSWMMHMSDDQPFRDSSSFESLFLETLGLYYSHQIKRIHIYIYIYFRTSKSFFQIQHDTLF